MSEYGMQLREKQKVKRIYGILEKQFRNLFKEADRRSGMTGENLLSLLEKRLDNVVFRMGFASSRSEARQVVRHGHVLLNGKKADIPSILVKKEDVVSISEAGQKMTPIQNAIQAARRKGTPGWVEVDLEKFSGRVATDPSREEITLPINEQLIVELYSR